MSITISKGGQTKAMAHGSAPDTPTEIIDGYLRELKEHQHEWASYPIEGRIKLLEQVHNNLLTHLDEWVEKDLISRRIPPGHPETMVSYRSAGLVGACSRNYIYTLKQIKKHGGYKPYVKARQSGQRVVIDSFPGHFLDKIMFHDTRAELWLQPGTRIEKLPEYQAAILKEINNTGGISFIMSGGNVSASTFGDLYQKLIMEKHVCIIKTHPVQEYMADILSKVLAPFIEAGFVRIVSGGAVVGSYLSQHPLINQIAFTGSDKTFDSIVYGVGSKGAENKKNDIRLTDKDVACELGSVTPVIVVPGDWSDADLDYQARNIFNMLAHNNGYACIAGRMLVLPKSWDKSELLVQKLDGLFKDSIKAVNYYPGTEETIKDALESYPHASQYGELTEQYQPFIFAKDLDPKKDEIAFTREFWATFMGQTYIDGSDADDFLMNAVKFVNEKVWGTLAAVIIIDPKTQAKLSEKGSFQKAIEDLRYGTVITNAYAGLALSLGTNTWGGYPGSTYTDIQSGNTYTLNSFLLSHIEKSVVYAPFGKLPLASWNKGVKIIPDLARAFSVYQIKGGIIEFIRLIMIRRKHTKKR